MLTTATLAAAPAASLGAPQAPPTLPLPKAQKFDKHLGHMSGTQLGNAISHLKGEC